MLEIKNSVIIFVFGILVIVAAFYFQRQEIDLDKKVKTRCTEKMYGVVTEYETIIRFGIKAHVYRYYQPSFQCRSRNGVVEVQSSFCGRRKPIIGESVEVFVDPNSNLCYSTQYDEIVDNRYVSMIVFGGLLVVLAVVNVILVLKGVSSDN